jgi:hypothetical protein
MTAGDAHADKLKSSKPRRARGRIADWPERVKANGGKEGKRARMGNIDKSDVCRRVRSWALGLGTSF